MAQFPTAKKDFKTPVDNENTIEAGDITSLQQESRAIQDFLGIVTKVQNIGLLTMLLDYRQAVAIEVTAGDTVKVPAQRMMIDQRACVNTADITLDLDGNIDGSGSSSVSTTYYVYAVDDNVPAGTYSMTFRTSNADNFTGERKIGSVTTAPTGSPPNITDINDDDAATEKKLVKAWVNFDGTAVDGASDLTGVNSSFNIASVVDNGTGDYTINFDTDFADTNYVVIGNCIEQGAGVAGIVSIKNGTTLAVGSCTITCETDASTAFDPTIVMVSAIGNQ